MYMKQLPADIKYLPDIYQDNYFPNFLVGIGRGQYW
jgi:hypothetical protein